MTNLQKIEFDMLKEFVDICDTLGLKYYLVCGSALGAVKYKGFIPWDDDLDVALMRSDYEIFCKEAPNLLPSYMFLQTYITDQKYPFLSGKLRNKNTAFIESGVDWLDMNHGVYIDVFPIDGYPIIVKEQQRLEKQKKIYKLQCLSATKTNRDMKLITRTFLRAERLCGFHKRTAKTLDKLSSLLSSYKTEDSTLWCNHGNWQGKLEYAPREQYGEGTWATFEGLKVRIPEKFDEYLTQKYGDWRADLPEDQKVGHHYTEVIDLNRPYTDYIEKLSNGKIRIKSKEEVESF